MTSLHFEILVIVLVKLVPPYVRDNNKKTYKYVVTKHVRAPRSLDVRHGHFWDKDAYRCGTNEPKEPSNEPLRRMVGRTAKSQRAGEMGRHPSSSTKFQVTFASPRTAGLFASTMVETCPYLFVRCDVLGHPGPVRLAQLGVRLLVDLHLSRPLV